MTARSRFPRRLALSALGLMLVTGLPGANTGPIRKLAFDPSAPVVDLFDGIERETLSVRVVPKDEFLSNVFITNETAQPVTVGGPRAAAAVHLLPQFLPGNNGTIGNGTGVFGNTGTGTGNGQTDPAQSVAGPMQPTGTGSGFPGGQQQPQNQPFPPSFFSIPAEKTVQLQLQTVCLDYGRREPNAKLTYQLRRLEDTVSDPVLRIVLQRYEPNKTDRKALQAAAWHLANGLNWKELAAKQDVHAGGIITPHFTSHQIRTAQRLIEEAENVLKRMPAERLTARQ